MGKIAVLFPGQGAQKSGMGQAWLGHSPAATRVFNAAEAIQPGITALCACGTQAELNETIHAQPCLFCVDLAAGMALREAGIHADMVAGFSLGEIPALAYCGMLSMEDAFRLVCVRAKAMQACAGENPGGMAAVLSLANSDVEALCAQHPGLYPANYNCPGQLVVSGTREALAAATPAIKAAGGKVLPLRTNGAFHTPLMQKAGDTLDKALATMDIHAPKIPLYAITTAAVYAPDFAQSIARQVTSPVLFQQTLEAMAQAGADTFIEAGVGKTLAGFVRKTLPDARVFSVEDSDSLQQTLTALRGEGTC